MLKTTHETVRVDVERLRGMKYLTGTDSGHIYATEKAGRISGRVKITVDFERLIDIAVKAIRNKNGKSSLHSGAIKAEVIPGTIQTIDVPHEHTDRCRSADGQISCQERWTR